MFKKILLGIAALIGALVLVLVVRALTFRSKQLSVAPVSIKVDANALAQRLGRGVQFKTISHQDPKKFDAAAFTGFNTFLQTSYPNVHKTLKREVVGAYSLLYTWKGSDAKSKPILLMGHTDVVPVSPGTEKDWKHPAFSGKIVDGAIWGRGTLDDKVAVMGLLEAAEWLVQKGFKPKRTIYFAFGHDEEVGGKRGAKKMAALLKKRGVKLEFVLDEGMAITKGIMPGLKTPLALIGIAEKGYATVVLSTKAKGGHSSMPPKTTAIGRLSRAIHRLEQNPMPARIAGVTKELFAYAGPEMGFGNRLAIANMWLLGGVLKGILSKKTSTNATIRTTTAATVFHGGVKENVLPASAKAIVNFRILPGDTIKGVVSHVKRVIDDPQIKVSLNKDTLHKEPSPISDPNAASFQLIHKSLRQVFTKSKVAPGLVIGGTDSIHYTDVTDATYRFLPIEVNAKDLKRIHGTNERITVDNYAKTVQFFIQLMRNAAGGK